MQSSSSSRPFKPGLIGASPITDAICPRSSVRSERHRAEVEAAGASPAVDAIYAPVPQKRQGEFRKLVLWPCASTRCESDQGPHSSGECRMEIAEWRIRPSPFCTRSFRTLHSSLCTQDGGHGVTAALRLVRALVSVQIRLATPNFDGAKFAGCRFHHLDEASSRAGLSASVLRIGWFEIRWRCDMRRPQMNVPLAQQLRRRPAKPQRLVQPQPGIPLLRA